MRITSILLVPILLLSMISVNTSGGPDSKPSTIEYDIEYSENLVITDDETLTWENLTILVHRGISIRGSLTIRNCTVHFNTSGIYNLGYLNISDLDGDPATDDDFSNLLSLNSSTTQISNSEVSGLFTNGIRTGHVNIVHSTMEGFHIFRGIINIQDVQMKNCSIEDPEISSVIDGLEMVGNGIGTAIGSTHNSIPIDDVAVSNYQIGLYILSTLNHRNLTIEGCQIGLLTVFDGPRIMESRMVDNSVHIRSWSNITLIGVEFINGTVDFDHLSVTAIQNCSFTGLERVSNISNGVVRRSTFIDCGTPITNAVGSLMLENKFIRNEIALLNSQDCIIYHNSFIDNMRVATGPPLSTWYNETQQEGNYYDIYKGLDDGSSDRRAKDGIGDTQLPFLSRDPYPLMQDEYWNMPQIPEMDVQYEIGSDMVELNWEQKGTNFILQRSTNPDFSTHLVSWSTTEPNRVIHNNPNSTLNFRVRGFNSYGSRGWSYPVNVLINQKPLPPTNIRIEPVAEGGALLVRWEWQGEDVDRGIIFIKRGGMDLNHQIVYNTENAHILRNLENTIIYSIQMISLDQTGLSSEPSKMVNATPIDQVPPPPPRNVRAITKGNESIALEWDPPFTQDLWGYIVYRRGWGSEDFIEITRFSKGVLYFEDQDLRDNTTYEYALASVDDDGPVSELSEITRNTTLHFNQRPVFTGSELILYLVEDEGPLSSGILDDFTDPDGDKLSFSIMEYFPFRSKITDGILWIIPNRDQAGEGYVQIQVSDGEGYEPYLIGIIVEPVDDPPRDVSIVYPINGSVLLPGAPVTLEASGFDPDSDQGDILNVSWSSDRDGVLHISTQSILRAIAELSNGVHEIELRVEDRTGNVVTDRVTVVVSLWGWGDIPWSIDFNDDQDSVDASTPIIDLELKNDSPLVLRFNINGRAGTTPLNERSLLVGPRSKGQITIQIPTGLEPGEEVTVDIVIDTQTLNGTYGGTIEISRTFTVGRSNGPDNGGGMIMAAIAIISLVSLLCVGLYIFYTFRFRPKMDHKGD